jgi:hypothetical protein
MTKATREQAHHRHKPLQTINDIPDLAPIPLGTLVRIHIPESYRGHAPHHGHLGYIVDVAPSRRYPYTVRLLATGERMMFYRNELEVPQDE